MQPCVGRLIFIGTPALLFFKDHPFKLEFRGLILKVLQIVSLGEVELVNIFPAVSIRVDGT